MRWTNKYGIDETIAQAIMRMEHTGDLGDITVTQLVRPPQMACLEREHWNEIEEDVSDGLWRLLGQALHYVLQQAPDTGALKEERLEMEIDGWRVTGQPDLYREPATLIDFKITSVWAFLLSDKQEWEDQVNYYAVLYRNVGFPVESAKIAALLRDWQASRYTEGGDYPPIPFVERPVKLWAPDVAERRLRERVRLHQEARRNGAYPPCTDQERWARPDTWAVVDPTGRAVRNGARFADERSAQSFARELLAKGKKVDVQFRPGQQARCERFCRVARWCKQAQALGVEPKQ